MNKEPIAKFYSQCKMLLLLIEESSLANNKDAAFNVPHLSLITDMLV